MPPRGLESPLAGSSAVPFEARLASPESAAGYHAGPVGLIGPEQRAAGVDDQMAVRTAIPDHLLREESKGVLCSLPRGVI